ncbi:ATP-dependent endonuclease [Planctomycetales bacterium 10988]|nr:ATP-dependent endonuclease [Planctomycetales bacterium 10988]
MISELEGLVRSPLENLNDDERPVLVLLEGQHDLEFLKRMSLIMASEDQTLVPLEELEEARQIVMLPVCGNGPRRWMHQLSALCKATFFLFDREVQPESLQRQQAVRELNRRPRFRAVLTKKRSLENYLHPQAIFAAKGLQLQFTNTDDVGELAAIEILRQKGIHCDWDSLSLRTRKRLRSQAKRWLNSEAVEQMTTELLRQSDPEQEILGWLRAIRDLVATNE